MKTQIAALLFLELTATSCEKVLNVNDEGNLVPRTVETDPTLPAIFVNGAKLHAETYGNPANPMLVVLHGGPGNDYRALLNCKAFADSGYYVVFYDQRGSGLSQRFGKNTYAMQTLTDELGGVIDYYRTSASQKVFLLGHSWGAMLASIYVNEHPNAPINGMILCEPGGLTWTDIEDYSKKLYDFGITSELLNDVTYMDQFLTGGDDAQALLDYKFGMKAISDGEPGSPIGNEGHIPFWRHGAVVNKALFEIGDKERPDWTTNLHMYSKPILFIYSENNKAYGLEWAQHVAAAYNSVQIERINSSGHDMLTFKTGFTQFFPMALQYLNSL